MNGRRLAGAVLGGTVAGIALSAMMIAGERKTGKPSELAELERRALARLGEEAPLSDVLPSAREQAAVQGGHVALSALAGAAYAAATDEESGVVGSGLLFGAAFYAAMHWIVGPVLRVKQPEWRAGGPTIGMHAANHLAFGLVTAAAAKAAQRL